MSTKLPAPSHRGLRWTSQILLLVAFVYGFYTTTFFFLSFIGLAIGILYFIFLRRTVWRIGGFVLAWTAGISTLVLNVLSDPSVGSNISSNLLAMTIGPSIIVAYLATFAVFKLWQRRSPRKGTAPGWFGRLGKKMPRYAKVSLALMVVLVPTVVWCTASINPGVLLDNNPRLLWVHSPSTVDVGTSFPVTVEAWDAYERLSAVYWGTVQFSVRSFNLTTLNQIPSVNATLPGDYMFTGQPFGSDIAYEIRDGRDNGLHVFAAMINTPGIHYLLVNDSVTRNTYWSNPILVANFSSSVPKIYWGDVHGHSALSDGTGTPEHHYYYARYVACLDYDALTDHGETMLFELGALDYSERVTNLVYDPGSFVALQGTEWTQTSTGHYTCIFSGDKLPRNPIISYMTIPTTQELWNLLDDFTGSTGCQALALPHHTTKLGYIEDWTYINPKYVKTAEVTSVHGESLFEQRDPFVIRPCGDAPPVYTPGTCIMDAFKMGYRVVMYASADEHDGHPGHSLAHTDAYIGHQRPWTTWHNRISMPCPGGITAVYAFNLTRNSVFDGLENQRIYASSDHGRPYISFTINGTRVGDGSTLTVTNASLAREISVVIAQDGAPAANIRPYAASVTPNWVPDWQASVQIFKNGNLLKEISINGPVANLTFLDTAPVTGTSYGIGNCVLRDGHYYINQYSDNPIDPSTLNTGGADFYLIRVVGQNGRTAYSGPIWVEVSP
ncbi:MAG: DUF3604 domain-containing protein [Candidatus Atabeyarchaeum deiterrae]